MLKSPKSATLSTADVFLGVVRQHFCFILGALCLVIAASAAKAANYTLEKVVQQNDVISGKFLASLGTPVINDPGRVVFLGRFAGGQGIFTPDEALVLTG